MEIEKKEPLNFSEFFEKGDDWLPSFTLFEGSLGEKLIQFSKEFIYLEKEMFYELLIAYACVPSTLSKILPILFLCGDSGTGKSSIGKLISALWHGKNWGREIILPNSTYASIRNSVNEAKYHIPELEGEEYKIEKNGIMVWDDIDAALLTEESPIYRLLKVSCDRATDTVQIAGKDGKNLKFRTFLPKVVSSVSSLFVNSDLPELHRRAIVIPTEISPIELNSIESINWDGFDALLWNFWNTEENAIQFTYLRKSLSRKKWTISLKRKSISVDIAAAGITLGIWSETNEAISFFDSYWREFDMNIAPESKNLLEQCIDEFLSEQQEIATKLSKTFHKFSAKELNRHLKVKRDLDIIEQYTQKQLDTYLKSQNWIKDIDGFFKLKSMFLNQKKQEKMSQNNQGDDDDDGLGVDLNMDLLQRNDDPTDPTDPLKSNFEYLQGHDGSIDDIPF